ncbi:MAG: hypothetical protein A2Y93_01000 [Chloroflexi bacterium RBG_13_68_17]|nr:MAG: hypothetical protein A2Y93_01000 [Chloroflexi bacterium RBG_13_68_17]
MEEISALVDRERLEGLLVLTSRTFAINIPMLPDLLRDGLTLGYLLLRNADSLEDAYRWPKERRLEGLDSFHDLMLHPDGPAARRFADRYSSIPGLEDAAQAELLAETPYLLTELAKLPEGYGREVRSHVARIARRMQLWVADHDDGNQLRLRRLQQLDDYCYSVAGIVGELVTSLIALYRPTLDLTRLLFLRTLETGVGAGLQLTNILKDAFRDHLEGRYYIPHEYLPIDGSHRVDRIRPIFAYAYRHLSLGIDYTCTLPEGELAIRKAVLVPILLAGATLVHLLDRIEDLFRGVEVKISREQVAAILDLADRASGENQSVRSAWRETTQMLADLRPDAAGAGG